MVYIIIIQISIIIKIIIVRLVHKTVWRGLLYGT